MARLERQHGERRLRGPPGRHIHGKLSRATVSTATVSTATVSTAIVSRATASTAGSRAHQPAIRMAPAREVVRRAGCTPPKAPMSQAEMRKRGT
jgi:hypothetical protein